MIDGTLHDTKQPTTTAEWATFEFEPVPPEELRTAPTYADWMKMRQSHLVALSLTWKILGATKEDLKKFIRENRDDAALNELLKSLAAAKNTFECFYHTTRAARARLICASAAEVEDNIEPAERHPPMSMNAA